MKYFSIVLFLFALVCAGCGTGNNGNADGNGIGDCPDMRGMWSFGYDCPMSSSGQGAEMTQDGCQINSIWKDDNTPHEDILSGTVDKEGNISVTINFGDNSVTCTGTYAGNELNAACTPGDCDLSGEKV
jgi:hypothetical protein